MDSIFLGIDPGKRGAIAALDARGELLALARFSDAETDGRIALIVGDTIAALPEARICATIEKVGAMPGQGVTSMFSFGRAYGEAVGALILCRARLQFVRPQTWQKDLALSGAGGDKAAHKRALKQAAEAAFSRRFTLDECDAVLIAEWSRRFGRFENV